MNRNTEAHFSLAPHAEIKRSLFDRSTQLKTSFNAGLLIPIFADEYLPGDTFTLDTSLVIRTNSPFIKPVMDNMYIDLYYFSVPNRLVWEHWKEFMGENTSGPWTQTTEYTIPQVTAPEGGWETGTLADYFTIPTKVPNISISAFYARAYALIWNEFFRDQNLQNPTNVPKTDSTAQGTNNGTLETDACLYGKPLPTNKYHDYFTSALPQPQKGEAVNLPLGTIAPIYGIDKTKIEAEEATQFTWYNATGEKITGSNKSIGIQADGNTYYGTDAPNYESFAQTSLYTDLTKATSATINQLRQAFAIQKLLERDARSGTRYIEVIKGHFNVESPDARQQRPEYLGGKRIPINVQQVTQTSSTDTTTPQANISAYSLTSDKNGSFTKSFTEHGMIIGLATIRTEHTYQQGINKMFSRKRRYDYYWPALANIGEQAILNKEIYATGTTKDEEGFGYQEAWAEYRYKPSSITGQMRSNNEQSLDIYHFGDDYSTQPLLGQEWIKETKSNIDRTLAVPSTTSDQFIADFYFKLRCARPMPVYSIPGLLDHN